MFGKSEDREDYQQIERPVGGMARDLPDRFYIDYHTHVRGQLIYASTGSIVVTTSGCTAAARCLGATEREALYASGRRHRNANALF